MTSVIASEREARLAQRLRGAQRHQIPDVDFGLSFPAFPGASQQSNKEKTPPEVALNSQLPAKQTPQASLETNTPLTRSKRKTPEISPHEQEGVDSVKRRRLDDHAPSSTRSSRSQSRRDIYELDEEEPGQDALQSLNAVGSEQATVGDVDIVFESSNAKSKTPPQDGMLDQEEVGESPSSAPGSGRRRRSSQSALSATQDQESSVAEVQQLPVDSSPIKIQKIARSKASIRPSHKRTPKSKQYDIDELDELSPEQTSRTSLRRSQEQFSDDMGEGDEAEEIDDHEAAHYMEKNRRRDVPDEDSLEIDELEASEDMSGLTGASTPAPKQANNAEAIRKAEKPKKLSKASPAAQRHPKPKSRKSKGATDAVKRPRGPPIPVTVYRLTKAPNYDEGADEADILISKVPYFKRAGANAVDVLSQVAEELIETGLSTLEDGASNADARTKKEWVVKLRALTHYQQEIRPRLLELSSNLDHGYSVARRIRVAQKERVELREDVMRIRREREQIALRMDEIRIKQEEDNKHLLARNEINNAFHDIENAVERGKAMPEEEDSNDGTDTAGLEMLLKSVAAEVSNASDEGGVLKQVKEFNAFLERAALALEGRV